jgi:hypothetical protein
MSQLNKIIAKQRKMAEAEPYTGYSAIISGLLEEEAKGRMKHVPIYGRDMINNFYKDSIAKLRATKEWQDVVAKSNGNDNDETLVFSAVVLQATVCNDMTDDEFRQYFAGDINNCVKALVNLKLLPERWLSEQVDASNIAF